MKKRWVILLSNILSIILIAISLSGCKWFQRRDSERKAQKEGGFLYYVKSESAIILDLLFGKEEIEELVIPETLGGYPVKQIGDYQQKGIMGGQTSFCGIEAKNIKKIVLNHFMHLSQYSFIEFYGTLDINSEQEYVNSDLYKKGSMVKNIKTVYINVPKDIDNFYSIYDLFIFMDENHYGIIFHENGDEVATSGIINHIETDLEVPETPIKEGYKFVDWFTDKDCSQKWNPDDSIFGEKVTDVYAKWIEV